MTSRPKTRQAGVETGAETPRVERAPVVLGPTAPIQRATVPAVVQGNSEREGVTAKTVARFEAELSAVPGGSKFEDREFPAGPWAMWADAQCPAPDSELPHPSFWKRLPDLAEEGASLWGTSLDHADIKQGALGSGFLLSTLALLTQRQELLRSAVVAADPQKGAYALVLCFNAGWRGVLVDDLVPCNSQGLPLFSSSKSGTSFWVAVIEKALAKIHGCYEHINGGVETYAWTELTGVFPVHVAMRDEAVQQDARSGRLWQLVASRHRDGAIVTCSIDNASPPSAGGRHGLAAGVSHLVVKVVEVEGLRLLQLFSPYGKESVWTGRFSDTDRVWREKPELRQRLGGSNQEGLFWMDFSDFSQIWTDLSIGRLCHTNSCRIAKVSGFFDYGQTPQEDTNGLLGWHHDPQFGIAVKEHATAVVVTLSQPSTKPYTGEDHYPVDIGLRICLTTRAGHWQVRELSQCITIAQAATANERQVTLEAVLEPQDDPYAVVLSTGITGMILPFTLSVCSQRDFSLLDPLASGLVTSQFENAKLQPPGEAAFSDIFEQWFFETQSQVAPDGRPMQPPKGTSFLLSTTCQQWRSSRPGRRSLADIRVLRRRLQAPELSGKFVRNLSPIAVRQVPLPDGSPIAGALQALARSRPSALEALCTSTAQACGTPRPAIEKLLGNRIVLDHAHVECADRVCIDWASGWHRAGFVVRDWEGSGERGEQVAEGGPEALVPSPTMSSLRKLVTSRSVLAAESHATVTEVSEAETWVPVKTIEDILSCCPWPSLHVRFTLATPSKPKVPALVSIDHEGQGSLTAIAISWEPVESDTPITGYNLAVTEMLSSGEQIGDVQKFEVGPNTHATLANVLSTRRYGISVSGRNTVGSGPLSAALELSPARMLDTVLVRRLGSHKSAALALAVWKAEGMVVTGSRDHQVCLWSVNPPELRHAFHGHTGAVYAVAIHQESGTAFSGSEDGTIRAHDLRAKSDAGVLPKIHEGPVRALAIDGDQLFSAGGVSIAAWDATKRKCLAKKVLSSVPRALHIESGLVYAGMEDGMTEVWPGVASGEGARTLAVHPAAISAMCGDNFSLLTCCEAGRVRLWRRAKGTVSSTWEKRIHSGPINGIALLRNRVVTAAFDGSLGITAIETGARIFGFPLNFGSLHAISPHPTEAAVFIATQSGAVALIRVPEDLVASSIPSKLSVS